HLLHEGRKGREVLGHALVVADDGVQALEYRKARALGGRDVTADLSHQGVEGERLECDRLTACVRTGDEQEGPLAVDLDVHRNDVPAVTNGDESIGKDPVVVARLEQALEVGHDASAPFAQVTAQVAEAGARVVLDGALVIESGTEAVAEIVHAGKRLSQAADGGRDGPGRSGVGRETRGRLEEGDQEDEVAPIENAAGNPSPIEDGADIRAVDRGWADFGQSRAGLTGRFERFPDGCEHGDGFGAESPFPTNSGPRLLRQQSADGIPFDASLPDSACLHLSPHSLPSITGSAGARVRSAAAANRTSARAALPS